MRTKEKLIARFLSDPRDFHHEELVQLMKYLNYKEYPTQSGSRIRFMNSAGRAYTIHTPHGKENAHPTYQIKEITTFLKGDESFERLHDL